MHKNLGEIRKEIKERKNVSVKGVLDFENSLTNEEAERLKNSKGNTI